VNRDSAVGIRNGYGLQGSGIESLLGRDLSRPALGSTQRPIKCVPVLHRGQVAGAWRSLPTASSADIKESR
jgi:hypothetical protein